MESPAFRIFDDPALDRAERQRCAALGLPYEPLVYVPMAADILHPGHINILRTAASLGRVMVGLFTDEAISSYKPAPYMTYDQRAAVLEAVRYVTFVVPQVTKDYSDNLRLYRPEFMVHGTDWRAGPLADVRQKAIDLMAEWGGQVVEPEYTQGVSSSQFKERLRREGKA